VVKLMDFGISHMVDLERLTVTGQLLGSPAYMAPEHVEGRPIDYRTDVFAAGIVLYQLTVGRLPFEGKNPHEVLKRIAECRFVDPRQANARIGNRLGKIILRAMAAEPDARFPAIGEMVTALEGYLEESGIAPDKVPGELGRYFASPPAYELALEERLLDHLTRRGQQLLTADERAQALDIFDRVLTIDPDNEKVIAILDSINRRTRAKASAMMLAGAAVLATGAYVIHQRLQPPDSDAPDELANGTLPVQRRDFVVTNEPAPPAPAGPHDAAVVTTPSEARPGFVVFPDAKPTAPPSPPATGVASSFRVYPSKDAQYRIDGGDWRAVPDNGLVQITITSDTGVEARNNSGCCQQSRTTLKPGDKDVSLDTPFFPALIDFDCAIADARVMVDGVSVRIDKPHTITFDNATQPDKSVKVEFLGEAVDPDAKHQRVSAGKTVKVKCEPR
ncbi:MAG TPA: protein kinase, partial [Kofleriaceae bacterium]|nr:protein kinase [Kofleriaceae bacterium]